MATIAVKFRVCGEVPRGAAMFVVGDHPELGQWSADYGTQLQPAEITDCSRCLWEGTVRLPVRQDIAYRYFMGKVILLNSEPEVEVLWWETNIQPRHLHTPDEEEFQPPIAEFGTYAKDADSDATSTISSGWLEHQLSIQVRLHSDPIFMWKAKYREQTYSIKCSPIDYEPGMDMPEHTEDSGSMDGPPPCKRTLIFSYNLNTNDLTGGRQPHHGCIYQKGDYLVFSARGANQTHLGFQLDLFVHQKGAAEPRYIGSAHILPTPKINVSLFVRKVPIIGLKHRPIGELQVEILHIYPMPGYTASMEVSYQNHWKWRKNGSTLNIGHRGMGSSYKYKRDYLRFFTNNNRLAMVTENTVSSLHTAARNGADFVEFDVLLTKDLVPVIYHDFSVCISYAQKGSEDRQLLEIPVKDLKLSHLQSMKLYHCSSEPHNKIEVNAEDISHEDEQPFPTLMSCLQKVDISVGFNIEIKYPLLFETGESEMDNYFDLNPYIDQILKVVLKYAGERKIIFSTFHPDTCLMVQLKQNRYPVLLLANGPTKRYLPYKDWRCSTFERGMNFAKAEGLLGVNFQAEGLIQDLSIIPHIQAMGLVLFVWGEDLNEETVKEALRKQSVDGLIFDRITKHEEFRVDSSTDMQQVLECAASAGSLLPLSPSAPSNERQESPSSAVDPGL